MKIVLGILAGLLLTGCVSAIAVRDEPTVTSYVLPKVVQKYQTIPALPRNNPNPNGVLNGIITIDNMRTGETVSWTVDVENSTDKIAKVALRLYDSEYLDWVTTDLEAIEINPFTAMKIPVAMTIPDKAVTPKSWRFYIGVSSVRQGNGLNIVSENSQTVFVNMR